MKIPEYEVDEMEQDLWNMFTVFLNSHKRSDSFAEVSEEFLSWVDEVITNELSPKDLSTVDTYLKALGIYEKTDGDKEAEKENKD